uniref:Oxidoreductase-like domain-containing protein n=1 Tax=Rhizophora mucronata TaxID=61149 RepID=A0A2P2N0L9_RHIMU
MLELAFKSWPSMGAAAQHYRHQYHRNHCLLLCRVRVSTCASPSAYHRRRANPESAFPAHLVSVIGEPSWRRVSQAKTSNINARFQDPRFSFLFHNLNSWNHMATKNDRPKAEDLEKKERGEEGERKEEVEKKKPPPPPPEMPEPGDCCGSGCVRCVWDVYYEELEAYNKLYVVDSNPSNSRPS